MDKCLDLYGERLQIGDKVIPLMSEALIRNVSGIISDIIYDNKISYITIVDDNNNVLLKNVNSRYYSTKERYLEKENSMNIFSMVFYGKDFNRLTSVSLTNTTDINYEIPNGTCFVAIETDYVYEVGNGYKSSCSGAIFRFGLSSKVKFYYSPYDECQIIKILENKKVYGPISSKYKNLKNEEEFNNFMKETIKYFSDKDNMINDVVYSENTKARKFERQLIKKLKTTI